MMTDFFNTIAEIFETSFEILPILGNYANLFLVILASIAFIICARKFI